MTVTRWAISVDELLAREIKRSAAGEPISAWLADAARSKLRREGWAQLVAEYEAEHGVITDAEMQGVRKEQLRLRRRKPPAKSNKIPRR